MEESENTKQQLIIDEPSFLTQTNFLTENDSDAQRNNERKINQTLHTSAVGNIAKYTGQNEIGSDEILWDIT